MVKHIDYWKHKGHVIPRHIKEAYETIAEWERTQGYMDKWLSRENVVLVRKTLLLMVALFTVIAVDGIYITVEIGINEITLKKSG